MKVEYLSWSKMALWRKSPAQFIKVYFEGSEFFETDEMWFGKILGKYLETGVYDKEQLIQLAHNSRDKENGSLEPWKIKRANNFLNNQFLVTGLMLRENLYEKYEIELNTKIKGVPFKGYIDNAPEDLSTIIEIKSGKDEWNGERGINHGQTYVYALAVKSQFKIKPKRAKIVRLPTEGTKDDIHLTGEVKTFNVMLDEKILKNWENEVVTIWNEIQEAYIKWEKNREVKLDKGSLEEFKKLKREKDMLDTQMEVIREKIEQEMKEKGLDRYEEDGVNIYYTKKKKFEYDEKVLKAKGKFEEYKKAFEKKTTPSFDLVLNMKYTYVD